MHAERQARASSNPPARGGRSEGEQRAACTQAFGICRNAVADGSTQHDPVIKMGTALDNAKRELKEAWRDCRPSCASSERLFHYTSAEGLHGILEHKTLWLSKVSTFNDTSEMHYGGEAIREVIDKALRSQPRAQNLALDLEAVAEKGKRFVEQLSSHCYAFCFLALTP